MAVIQDNNFSLDTYGTRTERLISIQGNFASIQPVLAAPAHIATWAATCSDVFSDILSTSNVERNESEGATILVDEAEAQMESEYQNVRVLAYSIYEDLPDYFKDYGFDVAYPDRRADKFIRVNDVLETYDRHVAQTITPLLPSAVMTRLTNARNNFETALANQRKESSDASHAITALSNRFVSDTKMLNQLKAWWYAMLGKQDGRITLIGMVNPNPGGGAHVLPAPTGIQFILNNMTVSWSPVTNATSYSVSVSATGDSDDYTEVYAGADPHFIFEPDFFGEIHLTVKSRNQNGFSQNSIPYVFYYYSELPAPEDVNAVLIPETNMVRLTFSAVGSATTYKIFRSVVALGAPAGEFIYVTELPGTEYVGNTTSGMRNYFNVKAGNAVQLSAASSEVFLDMAVIP